MFCQSENSTWIMLNRPHTFCPFSRHSAANRTANDQGRGYFPPRDGDEQIMSSLDRMRSGNVISDRLEQISAISCNSDWLKHLLGSKKKLRSFCTKSMSYFTLITWQCVKCSSAKAEHTLIWLKQPINHSKYNKHNVDAKRCDVFE